MNNLLKLLSLSFFIVAVSADANEELWNALNGKDKAAAERIAKNDPTVDMGFSKDGKSVLDLVDELDFTQLVHVYKRAKAQREKLEAEKEMRRQLLGASRTFVFGGGSLDPAVFVGATHIDEQVAGMNEHGEPVHEVTVTREERRPAVQPRTQAAPKVERAARPASKTSARSSASLGDSDRSRSYALPKSTLVPLFAEGKIKLDTSEYAATISQAAKVIERVTLVTGAVLVVLDHNQYRVIWNQKTERAVEIDELVSQLLDPETLKQKLREKGLL